MENCSTRMVPPSAVVNSVTPSNPNPLRVSLLPSIRSGTFCTTGTPSAASSFTSTSTQSADDADFGLAEADFAGLLALARAALGLVRGSVFWPPLPVDALGVAAGVSVGVAVGVAAALGASSSPMPSKSPIPSSRPPMMPRSSLDSSAVDSGDGDGLADGLGAALACALGVLVSPADSPPFPPLSPPALDAVLELGFDLALGDFVAVGQGEG